MYAIRRQILLSFLLYSPDMYTPRIKHLFLCIPLQQNLHRIIPRFLDPSPTLHLSGLQIARRPPHLELMHGYVHFLEETFDVGRADGAEEGG